MLFPRNKVLACKARMFTWEVVTGFDREGSDAELAAAFAKDFPNRHQGGTPVFWEMIAFNAAEGRRHRFLVAVPCDAASMPDSGRVLPESVGLYALADRRVRQCDCGGNMRYAAVVGGTLYVLVFMEGRLCHWSEESGYGGDSGELIEERLGRFDIFLEKDFLFSRADSFAKVTATDASFDFFQAASRDPFWKKLSLVECRGWTPRYSCLVLALLLAFSVMLWRGIVPCLTEPPETGAFVPAVQPPELERPVDELPDYGEWHMKKPKAVAVERTCSTESLKIQGTVAGKIAQIRKGDGNALWLGVGDSIENLAVHGIGRDYVEFVCNGGNYVLRNGNNGRDN